MAEHRALGRSRGARRVDEDRQVLRSCDVDHRIPGAGMLAVVAGAELEQRLERHDLRVGEAVQAVHIVDEDLHEPGAPRAHLEDLVELLFVAGEEEARAAVVDDVLDLPRRVGRVNAVGNAAHRHGGEVRVEPLRAVVGDDRHDVARPQPERHQTQADLSRLRPILGPRDRAPDAEVLFAHGHRRPALAHDMAEQSRQRVLPVHREGAPVAGGGPSRLGRQRHVFFRFQRRVPRTLDDFMPR